jgi:hypothetical protein
MKGSALGLALGEPQTLYAATLGGWEGVGVGDARRPKTALGRDGWMGIGSTSLRTTGSGLQFSDATFKQK